VSTDLQEPGAPGVVRFLVAFGLYVGVVIIGGALLAPALYALAQHSGDMFAAIARNPFHRYVHRAMLLLALVGLWPFLRALGFRSLKDLGLTGPSGQWQKFAFGFVLSFIVLTLLSGIVLAAGARQLTDGITFGLVVSRLGMALLAAVTVAITEETLFRGALFGALRRTMHWLPALVLVSAIFAILHFMKQAQHVGPVVWYSGLAIVPQMLSGLNEFPKIMAPLLCLFLSGMAFGIAYQRTGNLYFPIGLHAGAIVLIKLNLTLTTATAGTTTTPWGTGMLVDGWFAAGALLLATAALLWVPLPFGQANPRPDTPHTGALRSG
jgi:membrane protease YdiL (CAAX protease family)